MGFVKPPNQVYDKILFVNHCQGYPWSWPDNIPCKEPALEGNPTGLQVRQSEYKGKVSKKLHFLLKDDEFTYCLRCGLDTVFVRGLLLGLQACLSRQADCQIIISPKISEQDDRVIFCNLWANNQRVKIEWDKDINLYSLAQDLSKKYFPDLPLEKEDHDESFGVPVAPWVEPLKEYVENQLPQKIEEDNSGIISRIKNKKLTFSPEEVAEIKAASGIPAGEVDFQTLLARNDADIKYLGLSLQESRQILIDKYGKRSRHLLTNEELVDFIDYIDSLIQEKSFASSPKVPDDCPF